MEFLSKPNWYDWVIVAALLYGVWSGMRTGFSGEIIRVIGLALMVVLGVGFYQPAGAWLKSRTEWDEEPANLVAFVGIAVIVFVVTEIVRFIVHKRRKGKVLSAMVENVGGACAGVLRMLVVMAWATIALCLTRSDFVHEQVAHESRAGSWLVDHLPAVSAVVDKHFPEKIWFLGKINRPKAPDVEKDPPTK